MPVTAIGELTIIVDPLSNSQEHGIDIYEETLSFVKLSLNVI